jgi:hypothetical protein
MAKLIDAITALTAAIDRAREAWEKINGDGHEADRHSAPTYPPSEQG